MKYLFASRIEPTLLLSLAAVVGSFAACSSSGGDTTSTGDMTSSGASTSTSGSTTTSGTGGSMSTSSTTSSTSTGAGGADPSLVEVDATKTPCFDLATGTSNADNPCTSGDLYFLTGVNVDLSAEGQAGYCVKGAATSLADVPTDYATCTWEMYIEGGNGLANTGYVVEDRMAAHHYRMQIVSNTLPTLKFHYDKID